MTMPSALRLVGRWFLAGCRIFVGFLVAKTGVGLLLGEPYRGYDRQDNLFTGGFILLIGAYIIFSTLFSILFSNKET